MARKTCINAMNATNCTSQKVLYIIINKVFTIMSYSNVKFVTKSLIKKVSSATT